MIKLTNDTTLNLLLVALILLLLMAVITSARTAQGLLLSCVDNAGRVVARYETRALTVVDGTLLIEVPPSGRLEARCSIN